MFSGSGGQVSRDVNVAAGRGAVQLKGDNEDIRADNHGDHDDPIQARIDDNNNFVPFRRRSPPTGRWHVDLEALNQDDDDELDEDREDSWDDEDTENRNDTVLAETFIATADEITSGGVCVMRCNRNSCDWVSCIAWPRSVSACVPTRHPCGQRHCGRPVIATTKRRCGSSSDSVTATSKPKIIFRPWLRPEISSRATSDVAIVPTIAATR